MRSIIKWAVENTPAMNTLMIGVLVIGAASMAMLKREVFPQFELEIILVTVPYPGASPEEVEQGICQKIEEAVRAIDGVKKQTSVAQEGSGFVVLELETYVDVQKTLNDIRSEIDRIPSFPELAEDPEVKQITFREAAIRVGVLGPDKDGVQAELTLRRITEQVRDELLALPSVSQANISGSRDFQIDVEISEDQLREYGLTLQQVAGIIRRQNIELPGGSMRTGTQEILLRGKDKGLVGSEIEDIPIVTQENGVVLKISDLGTVQDAFADVAAVNRINGRPGLVVSIDRTRSEDLLRLVDEVKEYVAAKKLPAGFSLTTWADRSIEVRDRMSLLMKNGLQGLVLVFVMLVIFLDLRLSFWVAMGIPIAVFGAAIVLLLGDKTLNMLSMFAFLMALGIVVDDAIVIGENIFAHQQLGKDGVTAAIDGTYEVIPSVMASVCTTIIAFLPLFFVSGVMGKFIAEMPVAVVAMLALSLVESALILPCHLAHIGKPNFVARMVRRYQQLPYWKQMFFSAVCVGVIVLLSLAILPSGGTPSPAWQALEGTSGGELTYKLFAGVSLLLIPLLTVVALIYPLMELAQFAHWISRLSNQALAHHVETVYLPVLRFCLKNPVLVVASAAAIAMMSAGLVTSGKTPFVVFPKLDGNEIEATVSFPDGTPETVTGLATKRLEQAIQQVAKEYEQEGPPVVQTILRNVGQVRDTSNPASPEGRATGSHMGKLEVELVPSGERTVTSQTIIDQWRVATGDIAGAETVKFGSPNKGPGGAAIEFKLLADKEFMDQLNEASEACQARLAEYGGVVDVRDDSKPGKWEFQIKVKDKAKSLGITLGELAQTVRGAYYGEEVMRLQRGRHEVKLMVRYPQEERSALANFNEIRVRTIQGEFPLSELAEVEVKRGYSEINRIDQKRSVTVTADVKENEANARDIVADLKANFFPNFLEENPHISVRWEGQAEQTNESVGSLLVGFIGALIAMFVLLTVEFRSYLQPLIIMCIIPFGVVGAIWGHYFMGLQLTMFTLFGLVALTGVVVNDSIVLMDFINLRYRSGMSLMDALIDAGRRRFRPVMLTSVTTIAGLTPLLTETSFQAQFLIPLAATLVFGLIVATVLVLVLIPTLYSLYERVLHGVQLTETYTGEHTAALESPIEDLVGAAARELGAAARELGAAARELGESRA